MASLSMNGVVAVWWTTRILQPLPTTGEAIRINGEDTTLAIARPGVCAAIGGDETFDALIPMGPSMSRLSNVSFVACLRGPDLARNEAAVRTMLASTILSQ